MRPSPLTQLVLILGPSGAGKTTLLRWLRQAHPELHFARSATTRPRRPGEGAEEYSFVSEAEFDSLVQGGQFLEWARVHGGARYGTLLADVLPPLERGEMVVRVVDVQGFDAIRRHPLFSGPAAHHALCSIFLLPENPGQLAAHIQKRQGITEAELRRRLESAERELKYADLCDFRVVNREGHPEAAWREVEAHLGLEPAGEPSSPEGSTSRRLPEPDPL